MGYKYGRFRGSVRMGILWEFPQDFLWEWDGNYHCIEKVLKKLFNCNNHCVAGESEESLQLISPLNLWLTNYPDISFPSFSCSSFFLVLVVLLVLVGVLVGLGLTLPKKAQGSVVSNPIGMKFGRNVPRVNTHRMTESDFGCDVILSRSEP